MFDLTKEIKLEGKWQKRYRFARFFLFLFFASSVVYFSWLVLFPSKPFDFFFRTPLASKNTIINPRHSDVRMVFDTAISPAEGNFSKIKVNLILENNSNPIKNGSEISVRKSYRSFFYPNGDPVTIKYQKVQNVPFPNGALLANGISVFLVSGETIYPINNPATFQSMGFDWTDVITATSEEIGSYQEGKLFTIASPHPNGTIFSEKESGKYYLIENGKKKQIIGSDVANSYLNKNPIIADEKSLETESRCMLKKDFNLINTSYSCQITIENIAGFLGNDYQYQIGLSPDVKIKEIHVVFKKTAGWEDLKLSLSDIKKKIIANYYGQPQ